MANVKFQRESQEWKTLNEFWAILQKHYDPENDDTYWQTVIDDVNKFGMQEPAKLRRELARTLINVLEDRFKEARKDGRL